MWYLSERSGLAPNIVLLNNALAQTQANPPVLTAENWRSFVADRVRGFDWDAVTADVAPFLPKRSTLDLLTRENVFKLLSESL